MSNCRICRTPDEGCTTSLVFETVLQHREQRLNGLFDCVKEAVANELRAFVVNPVDVTLLCVAKTRQDLSYAQLRLFGRISAGARSLKLYESSIVTLRKCHQLVVVPLF